MNVKKLLDSLTGIAGVLNAAGARRAANDVTSVKGLLPNDEQRDAKEALDDLRNLLEQEKRSNVSAYVKRLNEALTDEALFDCVHSDLAADKAIGKDEADDIAHEYTGGRKKWASRKAALEAIRKKFVERAYQESKMKIVQRYKVG